MLANRENSKEGKKEEGDMESVTERGNGVPPFESEEIARRGM